MNILLIGSGGREHAIARALAVSPSLPKIFAAPGNPGIAQFADIVKLDVANNSEVISFCKNNSIDYVFVGPEQPLAAGLGDALTAAGVPVFGPSKAAAQLESSKDFAKQIMMKYGVPTAAYRTFSADDVAEAREFIQTMNCPIVLKADGLAAGKGVIIAESYAEANEALDNIFGGEFGASGARVVIEEFMHGEEASVFAVTDGTSFVTLAPSQDHKRALDGDLGKNTGGMGAYAPAKIVTPELMKIVDEKIIRPTLDGMKAEGMPFVGCLYVGLMIENGTPRVVEFNCRFGDPETQAVLAILEGDFANLTYSAAKGALDAGAMKSIGTKSACCVVMASGGYPDKCATGFAISGLDATRADVIVYHAGTKRDGEQILTAGGRVLGVTGISEKLEDAIAKAYAAVNELSWENAYFRKDIGKKGI